MTVATSKPLARVWPGLVGAALLLVLDAAFILSLIQPLAFLLVAGCFVLIAAAIAKSHRARTLNAALVAAAAIFIGRADWTIEKAFVRTLQKIRPGMTERQVRATMSDYHEGTGWPDNPHNQGGVDVHQ